MLCLLTLAPQVIAQHVALEQPIDSNTNQLFSQLTQYRNLSKFTNEFVVTQNALAALFRVLTPAIKSFGNYTGVFTGNCSVFFEGTIEAAECNIAPTNIANVTLGGKVSPHKRLPEQYWHQLTLTNILLASISADWRRGKLQEGRAIYILNWELVVKQLAQQRVQRQAVQLAHSSHLKLLQLPFLTVSPR